MHSRDVFPMSNKSIPTAYMVSILLLVCFTYAIAQEIQPSFTLAISSPSVTWKSVDHIRVDVTVKNRTNLQLRLSSSRSAWERGEIIVRDGSGNVVPPIQDPKMVRPSGPIVFVDPRENFKESFNISQQFDLTRPGQYSFQVEKEDPTTKTLVKSNTLVLTITP
jgi:hypothetical protein